MKAVVDAAHLKNHRVAIHSYGPSGVKDAVRAGADSVEHGIELDDETIADMVTRGTVWVPTIDHNRYYIDARPACSNSRGSVRATVVAGMMLATTAITSTSVVPIEMIFHGTVVGGA